MAKIELIKNKANMIEKYASVPNPTINPPIPDSYPTHPGAGTSWASAPGVTSGSASAGAETNQTTLTGMPYQLYSTSASDSFPTTPALHMPTDEYVPGYGVTTITSGNDYTSQTDLSAGLGSSAVDPRYMQDQYQRNRQNTREPESNLRQLSPAVLSNNQSQIRRVYSQTQNYPAFRRGGFDWIKGGSNDGQNINIITNNNVSYHPRVKR